ncbi:MAG: hypothetical protein H6R10_2934 [Rhodocyclaceae bacterium]|nr:hypothetical protein [Rhodocyclaceae bacterium]
MEFKIKHGTLKFKPLSGAAALVSAVLALSAHAAESRPNVRGALESGSLGLHTTRDFRLADGKCADCATIPQALWYFQDDLVAVPRQDAAEFSKGHQAQADVAEWAKGRGGKAAPQRPPLVWVGSPLQAEGWRIDPAGSAMVDADGKRIPFTVVPKIASNLSYYDASSVRHFAGRPLSMRGRMEDGKFVARTLWPEDYRLAAQNMALKPLQSGESLSSLVRADGGGAQQPLAARVLWQREAGKPLQWSGKPVLAVMLNGAQGDDDEAHGGHFAIATGRFGPQGQWGDWLVNNFYNLDSVSEKGIIAATLPMDAYMADLNSGQSWYRPSYMLVAVLKHERAAALYQESISRVFNHFYRHDFLYRHATANCAGISLETLRSLGWNIPRQGPTSLVKAVAGLPYMAVKEGSLDSGKKAFDYMSAEVTDLYPFVAFEAAGKDILERLVAGKGSGKGFEGMLAEDIEALVYVRIPQFPSSRAFGQAPVASFDEYMSRVPEDKSQWKIVPVPPRPFPPELKDAEAPGEPLQPSSLALAAYGGFFGVTAVGVWHRRTKRRNRQ